MVFFAGQVRKRRGDSARLIMTGQAQNQSFDQSKFKEEVCARVFGIFNCSGGIHIDVKTYTSFASVDTSPPIDSNGNLIQNFGYQPGLPGDIVVVRLFYQWPVYVPLLGFNLADMAGGKRLMAATVAFRNEPYKMRHRMRHSAITRFCLISMRLVRAKRAFPRRVRHDPAADDRSLSWRGRNFAGDRINRKVTLTARTVTDLVAQVSSTTMLR